MEPKKQTIISVTEARKNLFNILDRVKTGESFIITNKGKVVAAITLNQKASTTKKLTKKPKKILIIEDDDKIRALLERFLTAKGYEVIWASDGLDGLNKFNNKNPDLVLLDTILPTLMGLDVCALIKKTKAGRNTPVIIMTSVINRAKKFQLEIKPDHILIKPFQYSEMLSAIEKLLKN